ncbi:hypothetical protein ACTXT7_006595 [Hymenolepis weldensis]
MLLAKEYDPQRFPPACFGVNLLLKFIKFECIAVKAADLSNKQIKYHKFSKPDLVLDADL